MAEENKQYKLADVTNETDAKVVFDPKIVNTTVAKEWKPTNPNEEKAPDNGQLKQPSDPIRFDGIYTPIIRINKLIVPEHDLISMKLYYTGFKPSIEIIVNNSKLQTIDTPGMVNKITIVMIPPENGTYKKISLDFYITSMSPIGSKTRYFGEYFLPALESKSVRVLKQEGNNKLSTYQLLETIAAECQLGFAATEQCKDIADTKIRLVKSQNLQEVINEHMRFSGLDDNSIFITWIDVYNYIVMCNLSWVLSKSVSPDQLSIKMLEGVTSENAADTPTNTIKYGDNTFRTFTNYKQQGQKSSNGIKTYEWIVNNQTIKIQGTNNTYFALDYIGDGGTNNILTENITITEDTADGNNFKNVYDFQKMKFLGIEMGKESSGNTPVLFQEKRRDAYINKISNKILKVELNDFNIGLERGMLINLAIYEYDRAKKAELLKLMENVSSKGNTKTENTESSIDTKKIMDDPNIPVININISGLFFINGIEYLYTPKTKKIVQTLYLIRQKPASSYSNFSSLTKTNV